jgi:chorismate synthase
MRRLTFTTAGESHGPGLTALLSGLPAGLTIDFELVSRELARRQHGFGRGRRMQIEKDHAEIRAGVRGGETLGSPIVLWVENRDFENWQTIMGPEAVEPHRVEQRRLHSPRPGHTDLAGGIKYLRRDLRDILERASARETTARVAAGALAKLFLREFGVAIHSGVRFLGSIGVDRPVPTWEELQQLDDSSPLRAIDRELEPAMIELVEQAKAAGDTLGGAVTVIAHNVPIGLGSHIQWDQKLDGRLAQAILSIPAIKAVEIGAGLEASRSPGSAAHDAIAHEDGTWTRPTNRAGGLEGGITNGQDLVITAYKKPIATLRKGLPSVDLDTMEAQTSQYERSDVTALPAAGVIAEAMVALVLADAFLEKVGGDSMAEVKAHWEATLALQRSWPDWPGRGA